MHLNCYLLESKDLNRYIKYFVRFKAFLASFLIVKAYTNIKKSFSCLVSVFVADILA